MTAPPRPPTARTYALLAAGVAAFVVFGSLVPFEFRARPKGDAAESFRWAMANRAWPESRSDGAANLVLGVPLGFFLLAAFRVDRRPAPVPTALTAVLLLVPCAALSAAVEYAQLFTPNRTCAGSDVYAQILGAACGMAGWAAFGGRLTAFARGLGDRSAGDPAVRRVVAYLALLLFVQTLPTDLTLRPAEIYRKLRDRTAFVPFGEFHGVRLTRGGLVNGPTPDADQTWRLIRKALELAGLYAPAGFLAAAAAGRLWSAPRVFGLMALAVLAVESVQLFVQSRTSSATDVVVGASAMAAGWAVGRWGPTAARPLLVLLWVGGLAVINWHPFAFPGPVGEFDWWPGFPLEAKEPLLALEDVLTKMMLFAPLGPLLAGRRAWVGAAFGAAVAAVFEVGQLWQPHRYAGLTDVVLGGAGAWAGCKVAGLVRGR